MARTFNGTSDNVLLSLGAANFAFGPGTIAAVMKSSSDTAAVRVVIGMGDAGATRYLLVLNAGHSIALFSNASQRASTATILASHGWVFIAVTKATGSATPQFYKYVYDTDTWTVAAGSGTLANSSVPTGRGAIGSTPTSPTPTSYCPADIAAAGVWNVVLADQDVRSLAYGLSPWRATNPKGLWVLDQDTVGQKVFDLTGGGANESGISGTSVATSAVPVFSYGQEPIYVHTAPDPVAEGRSFVSVGTSAVQRASGW